LKSAEQGRKDTALDRHRERQIPDWIQQNAEKSTPVSNKKIKDYCTSQFKASITRGWVNSFILRHPDKVMQTKSVPQDQKRLQESQMFPDRTVQNLNKGVQGCVAELVFNLFEVGISDWKDCKTRKVLVPTTMLGQTIHHGISRTVKHISVIACISAAGESLIPYMITSQDSASVREQLKKHGVRFGTGLVLKSNAEPDINREMFLMTSELYSSLTLLNLIRWMNLLKKWPCS
jgi:hypothetical protein